MPPGESPETPHDGPVFTAAEELARRRAAGRLPDFPTPDGAIFVYQGDLLRRVQRGRRTRRIKGFLGELHLLKKGRITVALAGGFGVGAPAAVALLEELAACGVRRFVSIGLAGGLQEDLSAGDLVVCERSIRDDGVSSHYLPPQRYAAASPTLTARLCRALQARRLPFRPGICWTTSAPYREMRSQVAALQGEGVLAVEMEAAALFAAGQALGVEVAAALSIADCLSGLRWRLDFDPARALSGLEALFAAALLALASP